MVPGMTARRRRGAFVLLACAGTLAAATLRALSFVPAPGPEHRLRRGAGGPALWLAEAGGAAALLGAQVAGAVVGVASADEPAASAGGDLFQGWVDLNAYFIEGIDNVVGSAGLAVIMYTCLLRLLLFPLSQPGARSSSILQLIQPRVDQIEEETEGNENEKTRRLRDLYAESGMNPLAVLAPVIVQLPVFVGLFRAIAQLAKDNEHFVGPFLWIPSLAGPVESGSPGLDWLIRSQTAGTFEPLVGWHDATAYLVLPVLVVLSQFFSITVTSVNKQMGAADILIPAFIGISTLVSPQGLGVYFFVNSMLSTLQTVLVKKSVGDEFPVYKVERERWEQMKDLTKDNPRYTRDSPFFKEDSQKAVYKSVQKAEEREQRAANLPTLQEYNKALEQKEANRKAPIPKKKQTGRKPGPKGPDPLFRK